MLKFELVLPCYNESRSLEFLIRRSRDAAIEAGFSDKTFQLVLVENGSRDNSTEVMDRLKAGELGTWFRMWKLDVNQGYGFGLMSGLRTTTAPFVAYSHADQQCDPKDAFRALKLLEGSPNPTRTLVKGVRYGRNWKDRVVSRVFEFFSWFILGLRIYEVNAQPKVFPRALVDLLQNPPKTFAFDLYVLFKAQQNQFDFKTISVLFPPRIHGVSNWASNFLSRYRTILGMIQYMWTLKNKEGRA